MIQRRPLLLVTKLFAVLALAVTACGDDAQPEGEQTGEWKPTQDVTMTVPFAAGGGTDEMARTMAAGLEEVRPGITIAVENRPGGSGVPGYTHAFQQKGDPHQLVAVEPNVVTVPMLTEAPFAWSEFTHIGQVSDVVGMAVAKPGRFEDLPDLIETAAQERVTLGLAGLTGHLAIPGALMEAQSDARFERVVFDSGAEIVRATLAGDVDFGIAAPEHGVEHMRAGTLEALAVFSGERLEIGPLAEVPTAAEQGIDVQFAGVRGLMAAPDITKAERQYWIDAFEDWTATDSYAQYIEDSFSLKKTRIGDEFAQYLREYEENVKPAIEVIKQTQK